MKLIARPEGLWEGLRTRFCPIQNSFLDPSQIVHTTASLIETYNYYHLLSLCRCHVFRTIYATDLARRVCMFLIIIVKMTLPLLIRKRIVAVLFMAPHRLAVSPPTKNPFDWMTCLLCSFRSDFYYMLFIFRNFCFSLRRPPSVFFVTSCG